MTKKCLKSSNVKYPTTNLKKKIHFLLGILGVEWNFSIQIFL
jgi:hypothetical protein